MSEFLIYAQDGPVITLTLNRPETRNALTGAEEWDAVVAACDRVQGDDGVKVAILTGAGNAFCAGGNVKDFRDKRGLAAGTPAENLLPEARALAARIAANPGSALRMTKRLLREAQTGRLDRLLELAAAYQALAHHSAEHKAAVTAFLGSRK